MCASDTARRATLALCLLAAWPVHAQQSREQEQIRRLRQQVQQVQQQQQEQAAALQRAGSEKAELQRRLDTAESELSQQRSQALQSRKAGAELQAELARMRADAAGRQNELTALKEELERSTKAGEAARAELAQRRALLATREATFADLWARHQAQASALQTCIVRNERLSALGHELLQRYEGKGVGELLSQHEPFLQLGRVQLENLVQGYREGLDQNALGTAGASPQP